MITIRDLYFSYRKTAVFDGLSWDLAPGRIYGLLGKNGTGKSTLLRSIAGTLFPGRGHIDVLGKTPGKRQPSFLQQVFLVPEDFHLPPVMIGEWVKYNAGFYPGFDRQAFDRIIGEFKVPTGNRLNEMSYGQQKKALISFALASNAPVLLMDEPTNGLDIHSKGLFRRVMAGTLDENRCIVISTHQVRDLENLIDRVTVIDEGKILFDQSMANIAQAFQFTISFDPADAAGALFSEPSLKGNALVLPNISGEEGMIDLEILYKAIVGDPAKMNSYFKA
jgi:ABC-2 type transport system ATP-binding protein